MNASTKTKKGTQDKERHKMKARGTIKFLFLFFTVCSVQAVTIIDLGPRAWLFREISEAVGG